MFQRFKKLIPQVSKDSLHLTKGTRFTSFVFIFLSMLIATGVLFAANTYYDLNTGEVVTDEIKRIVQLTRATGGLIAGGTATQNLETGVKLQVSGGSLRVGSGNFTVATSGNTFVEGTSTFNSTSTFNNGAQWTVDGTSDVIGLDAPANASSSRIYTLPDNDPAANYVLTTDGSGHMSWKSATSSDVGTMSGGGTADRVAMWSDEDTLTDSSIEDNYNKVALTIENSGIIRATNTISVATTSTSTDTSYFGGTLDPNMMAGYDLVGSISGNGSVDITGIGTFEGATATLASIVQSPEFTATVGQGGTTTIGSADNKGIYLDPDSNEIKIANNDYIETHDGYQIGNSGKQVLREMIPVFGFDLPARTNSASYKDISRVVEQNPFASVRNGATRRFKFIIRYADEFAGTGSTTWRLYSPSASTTFTVVGSASSSLAQGEVAVKQMAATGESIIQNGNNWKLQVKSDGTNHIQVFQIFLAAYDELN